MTHSRAIAPWVLLALAASASIAAAQPPATADAVKPVVKLAEPTRKGGLTVMEALAARASVRSWSDRELSAQDLSDLLWAANGINRPDKKRTAASALNAQDVDVYVLMKSGAYLYDAANHALAVVATGDHRVEVNVPEGPPVHLFLVSDGARFRMGSPAQKLEWGAIDTGIVSQNIALFCAARGLATRPRASFDAGKLRTLLQLTESQHPFLNQPVGYPPAAAK